MSPCVPATQASSGSRGSRSAERSLRSSASPTCGPLPWVTSRGRSLRWTRCSAVALTSSYWTDSEVRCPGGAIALPPRATTTGDSRTKPLLPARARLPARHAGVPEPYAYPTAARLAGAAGSASSSDLPQRDAPQSEPAAQLRLDRQVAAERAAHAQLQLVVAPLAVQRRERIEGAALVEVDEVAALARAGSPGPGRVEAEHRAQELRPVAALLQRGIGHVGAGDQVLEIRVAEHHPAVAEAVVAHPQRRAGLPHRQLQQLGQLLGGGGEVRAGGRLEADRRLA